jgi:hypothetical protein
MYIADAGNARVRMVDTHGNIATIAGNGTPGFSGDGGPANLAQVYDPWSIAVDRSGYIFFVDRTNRRIRQIGIDGNINTVAGNGAPTYFGDGGPATAAGLDGPVGVALDSAGNFYDVGGRLRAIGRNEAKQGIAVLVHRSPIREVDAQDAAAAIDVLGSSNGASDRKSRAGRCVLRNAQ